jgi:hypothetical protein
MFAKYLSLIVIGLGLIGCNYPSAQDAMKSCVKWGNKGVSIRSFKYGLTSHTRECVYDKENKQVIGYEKDAKNTKSKRKKVKYFDYQ